MSLPGFYIYAGRPERLFQSRSPGKGVTGSSPGTSMAIATLANTTEDRTGVAWRRVCLLFLNSRGGFWESDLLRRNVMTRGDKRKSLRDSLNGVQETRVNALRDHVIAKGQTRTEAIELSMPPRGLTSIRDGDSWACPDFFDSEAAESGLFYFSTIATSSSCSCLRVRNP